MFTFIASVTSIGVSNASNFCAASSCRDGSTCKSVFNGILMSDCPDALVPLLDGYALPTSPN